MSPLIEICLEGRPASVNSNSAKKQKWKNSVNTQISKQSTAINHKTPNTFPYSGRVKAIIYTFPPSKQYTDLDNALKYTIDGMAISLLTNDRLIQRIETQRFTADELSNGIKVLGDQITVIASALELQMKNKFSMAVKIEKFSVQSEPIAW